MQPPDQPSSGEPSQPVPPAPSAPPPYPEPAGDIPSKEERTWAMTAHLGSLLGYILVPFANVLVPLVIWLIKKETMPFVADQAKESLNFQLTVTIALVIGIVLVFVCVGWIIVIPAVAAGMIFAVIGAIKANDGVRYRYPVTLRIIN